MNTPKKFRVWDKITNQYLQELGIYYWHIPYSLDGEEITGEANLVGLSELLRHDNFVVQQYTGLKDKNGSPIYEGDIVKTIYNDDLNTGVIFYHEQIGSYRIQAKKHLLPIVTYRFVENTPHGFLSVVHEVIGNIFEHSELLNY